MTNFRILWREPLIHFLLIGAGIFLLFELTRTPGGDASNRIVVTTKQVDQLTAQFSRTWLRPPTDVEIAGLIDSFVRDEIYYREALTMGLDQNDPLIRRRMRQKLEFLLEDLSAESEPDNSALENFLQQNSEKFRSEPRVSFHQVYINADTTLDVEVKAQKILASLKAGVSPETLGDPTLLPHTVKLELQSSIKRSFGTAFSDQIVNVKPGGWTGPLYSGLGVHLVRVTENRSGRMPELAEVHENVKREYLVQRRQKLKDLAYRKLLERYEVVVETAIPHGSAGKATAANKADKDGP